MTLLCLGTGMAHAQQTSSGAPAAGHEAAWDALREGKAIVMMRHALAPGVGDPDGFRPDDCTTQRNLSDAGRTQAIDIGTLFRQSGIDSANVLSSVWCRCVDTAALLDLGQPTVFPAINSIFRNRAEANAQNRTLRDWLERRLAAAIQQGEAPLPAILVTHQVNISAFANVYTASGEIQIVTLVDGEVTVLASIAPPDSR